MDARPRPAPLKPAKEAAPIPSASFEAFAGNATVAVTDPAALVEALRIVQAEVRKIDAIASRFRPDSEIERLNAQPATRVAVSTLLLEAIAVAVRAAQLSNGAVDPTLGVELIAAGYDRDWRELEPPLASAPEPAQPRVLRLNRRPAWSLIEIDADSATIELPAGVRLDLGATAKALAADRSASAIAGSLGCGALVSLGGDIATAGEPPPGGWSIRVTDDHRSPAAAPGQTVSIGRGGLATSSSLARRWLHDGRNMHHIIDPRSGKPVRSIWRTVSVHAATCVDANTASTGAIVRSRGAIAWLAGIGLPARLVDHAGAAQTVAGWPPAG